MVLGMQWFQSLGPVLTNYKALTMKFIREGHTVELKGDTNSSLHAITPFQLRCLIITDAVGDFFHLQIVPKELPLTQTTSPTFPPEILSLITKFDTLFQTFTLLPPSRPTNYNIYLIPSVDPSVSVLTGIPISKKDNDELTKIWPEKCVHGCLK